MNWFSLVVIALMATLIVIILTGCGGGGPSQEEIMKAQLAAAESAAAGWRIWSIVIGVVALLIGCGIGSKARKDADGPWW